MQRIAYTPAEFDAMRKRAETAEARIRELEADDVESAKEIDAYRAASEKHFARIRELEARVAALTKFAEFCDYHLRSCTGLQGQHLECDCGYSDARDELRDALAQAEPAKDRGGEHG